MIHRRRATPYGVPWGRPGLYMRLERISRPADTEREWRMRSLGREFNQHWPQESP